MRRGTWEIVRQRESSKGYWEFTLRKVESGHMAMHTFKGASLGEAVAALGAEFAINLPATRPLTEAEKADDRRRHRLMR